MHRSVIIKDNATNAKIACGVSLYYGSNSFLTDFNNPQWLTKKESVGKHAVSRFRFPSKMVTQYLVHRTGRATRQLDTPIPFDPRRPLNGALAHR